ncbi:hypothetical protein ACXYTP_06350 [Tsukamurella ocularis]|uniref:hypothetical protein n=1 Tax=Tsukamurella ocularis TaxID=1970234 RepID=UPI0039F13779
MSPVDQGEPGGAGPEAGESRVAGRRDPAQQPLDRGLERRVLGGHVVDQQQAGPGVVGVAGEATEVDVGTVAREREVQVRADLVPDALEAEGR